MMDEPRLAASAAGGRAGYQSDIPGPLWAKRFNAGGLAGLEDEPRSGHPRIHDETVRSALIGLAGNPCAVLAQVRLLAQPD